MTTTELLTSLVSALQARDGITAVMRARLLYVDCDRPESAPWRPDVARRVLEALIVFIDGHNERVRASSLEDIGREVARSLRSVGDLDVDDVDRLNHMGLSDLARLQRLVAQRLNVLQSGGA